MDARFVICARKTPRLVEELRQAQWKPSLETDADEECEFRYQPEGWKKSIFSITGGGQVGVHEEPRSIVSARCLIRSAREGIRLAPLTRSRMY
jgi:hypothetical protein